MQCNALTWVDPHLHIFALNEGQYHWLKSHNPPFWEDKSKIAKRFYERDILASAGAQLEGFVHIEAGFDNHRPWREIQFLTRHCKRPFSAIACIDLLSIDASAHIDKLAQMSPVVGLRHILDDEAVSILRNPKAVWCFSRMATLGLSFEVQADMTDPHTVKALLNIFQRYPTLKFTINHCAVAPTSAASFAFQLWRNHLRLLAATGQVAFKFSGFEMQNRQWSWQHAKARFETLVDTVGVDRVMFASNYPLCTWRMPLKQLWQGYEMLCAEFAREAQQKLCALNARTWYGL